MRGKLKYKEGTGKLLLFGVDAVSVCSSERVCNVLFQKDVHPYLDADLATEIIRSLVTSWGILEGPITLDTRRQIWTPLRYWGTVANTSETQPRWQ